MISSYLFFSNFYSWLRGLFCWASALAIFIVSKVNFFKVCGLTNIELTETGLSYFTFVGDFFVLDLGVILLFTLVFFVVRFLGIFVLVLFFINNNWMDMKQGKPTSFHKYVKNVNNIS